jgi:hypothetical protein
VVSQQELLAATRRIFGLDFLRCDGAQLRNRLADGVVVRLRNAGGSLILAVEGRDGSERVRVFHELEPALESWLAVADETDAG